MAEIVRMPKLSDTMTEGVVAEWHKKVGDNIESGELLAEIETDKATMEFESFQEGVLLYIGVEKGQTAPVDSILAILGEKALNTALSSWNQSRIDTKITTAISYQDFLTYVLQTCINQDRFHPIKPNRHHAMVAAFNQSYDDSDDSDDNSTDNVLQAFVANHCPPQVLDEYTILAAKRRNDRNQKRKPFI